MQSQQKIGTFEHFFKTRGTCNPSGLKKIRDNFFVLGWAGWLVFDEVVLIVGLP